MFEIYLTKDAQNAMTREEAYVLTQSMRIFNSIRMFILIAEDIKKLGLDDNVSNKKYTELLLYQAANLYFRRMIIKFFSGLEADQ